MRHEAVFPVRRNRVYYAMAFCAFFAAGFISGVGGRWKPCRSRMRAGVPF